MYNNFYNNNRMNSYYNNRYDRRYDDRRYDDRRYDARYERVYGRRPQAPKQDPEPIWTGTTMTPEQFAEFVGAPLTFVRFFDPTTGIPNGSRAIVATDDMEGIENSGAQWLEETTQTGETRRVLYVPGYAKDSIYRKELPIIAWARKRYDDSLGAGYLREAYQQDKQTGMYIVGDDGRAKTFWVLDNTPVELGVGMPVPPMPVAHPVVAPVIAAAAITRPAPAATATPIAAPWFK